MPRFICSSFISLQTARCLFAVWKLVLQHLHEHFCLHLGRYIPFCLLLTFSPSPSHKSAMQGQTGLPDFFLIKVYGWDVGSYFIWLCLTTQYFLRGHTVHRGKWRKMATLVRGMVQYEISFLTLGFPGGSVVKNPLAKAGASGGVGSVPGLGRSPGKGNGTSLQYSCLEKPMLGGVWWATVMGSRSQTQLSDWTRRLGWGNTGQEYNWLASILLVNDVKCKRVLGWDNTDK